MTLEVGLKQMQSGLFDAAYETLNSIENRDKSGNIDHLKGCCLAQLGRWQEAKKIFTSAITQDRANIIFWINFGKSALRAEDLTCAETCAEEIIQINSINTEGWFLKAMICMSNKRKDIDKAITYFEKCLQINKAHIPSITNLAILQTNRGRRDISEKLFLRGLAIEENSPTLMLNYAKLLSDSNRNQEACSLYEKILRIGSTYELHYNYAECLIKLRRSHEAKEHLLIATNSSKIAHLAYYNLAKIMIDEKESSKNIAVYLSKSIEYNEQYMESYYALVKLYIDESQYAEASETINRLMKVAEEDNPNSITIGDKKLVLDKTQRRIHMLRWLIEFGQRVNRAEQRSDIWSIVRDLDARFFNSYDLPIISRSSHHQQNIQIKKGYGTVNDILDNKACEELINKYKMHGALSNEILSIFMREGLIERIIDYFYELTGLKHIIWNALIMSKRSDAEHYPTDEWHYDNNYGKSTAKILIYLNAQDEQCGATSMIDAHKSEDISRRSGYMGAFSGQHGKFEELVGNEANTLINSDSYYRFEPKLSGCGVWFYAGRVLHRAIKPKWGTRYVLSLSLTPVSPNREYDDSWYANKSHKLLENNIKDSTIYHDNCPYWLSNTKS